MKHGYVDNLEFLYYDEDYYDQFILKVNQDWLRYLTVITFSYQF